MFCFFERMCVPPRSTPLYSSAASDVYKRQEKQYGYRINEKCIGCGLCTSKCPQNCIDTLSIPFRIRENNCLHCGNCMEVCPNNAVEKIKKAAKYIKEADYILIGAGAGLSTAAGLTLSLIHI